MIGLQTIMCYIIIHLTHYKIRFYNFVIHICFVFDKTFDSYLYSTNIRSIFIFDNIRIRIHICFENTKRDMKRALSDPHPIRFHPYTAMAISRSSLA
jgi:hypothetical protein